MGRANLMAGRAMRPLRVGPVGIPTLSAELVDAVFNQLARALGSAERGVRSVQSHLFGPTESVGARRWWAKHPGVYAFQPPNSLRRSGQSLRS